MIYISTLIYVTGFVKRDHIPHFEMRVLQRSVFPQCYAQSKSNVGVLCSNDAEMKSHDCAIREFRGGVHGVCNRSEFFEKWHYYEGAYLGNGESFGLLAWDGIS